MQCSHSESITIAPVPRGPKANIKCDSCGAIWEIDSGVAVLFRFVIEQQEWLIESQEGD